MAFGRGPKATYVVAVLHGGIVLLQSGIMHPRQSVFVARVSFGSLHCWDQGSYISERCDHIRWAVERAVYRGGAWALACSVRARMQYTSSAGASCFAAR